MAETCPQCRHAAHPNGVCGDESYYCTHPFGRFRATAVAVVAGIVLTLAVLGARTLVVTAFAPPPAPVYVPSYFCPAGQHVVKIDSSGWPDCSAGN